MPLSNVNRSIFCIITYYLLIDILDMYPNQEQCNAKELYVHTDTLPVGCAFALHCWRVTFGAILFAQEETQED